MDSELRRRALRKEEDERTTEIAKEAENEDSGVFKAEREETTSKETERVGRGVRTRTETIVAILVHVSMLAYYLYVLTGESAALKISQEGRQILLGNRTTTYGGRWKYLTYINMVGKGEGGGEQEMEITLPPSLSPSFPPSLL